MSTQAKYAVFIDTNTQGYIKATEKDALDFAKHLAEKYPGKAIHVAKTTHVVTVEKMPLRIEKI